MAFVKLASVADLTSQLQRKRTPWPYGVFFHLKKVQPLQPLYSLKLFRDHLQSFHHTLSPHYFDKTYNLKPAHHSVLSHPVISLLERCQTLAQLKQIQARMVLSGMISDSIAASRLVAFCSISDSPNLDYCSLLLKKLRNPNLFSWNVAIRGYADSDQPKGSIFLYKELLWSASRPDNFTFPFLFKACTKMADFCVGLIIFGHALQLGLCTDLFVFNSLIHLFVVCGNLNNALKLFDHSSVRNLISWNTIINGLVQRGNPREALNMVRKMVEEEGVSPDCVTMIGALSSCAQLQALDMGRKFHHLVVEKGLEFTVPLTNALMDMYIKCGSLDPARALFDTILNKTKVSYTTMISGYAKFGYLDASRRLFDQMPDKDVIPWNALLAGYVQNRQAKDALALFNEMQVSTLEPDEVTIVCLLSACSQIGALEMGIWAHQYIKKRNFCVNVALGTALVDMYAKCGNINKASFVFKEMPVKNALTWTTMICGLANHGLASEAINHFERMMEIGLLPDEITFIGVLSACCHGGLLYEGRKYFSDMSLVYKLKPSLKHYSCMVDLLGRAGMVDEAEEMVETMPVKPDAIIWSALFFACRLHRNIGLGARAAKRLLELDPSDSGIYVLLASLYAEEDMRVEADQVWALMKERGVEKTPGCSSIEVNGSVYEFVVRDRSHSAHEEIYACLQRLYEQAKRCENLPSVTLDNI